MEAFNGVSLAFSIVTAPEIVSKALLGHEHLRIFTNNLNIAMLAFTNATLIFCDQTPPAMLEQSGAQLIVCKGDLSP